MNIEHLDISDYSKDELESYIRYLERENAALLKDKEGLDWLCSDMGNQWAYTHMNSMLEDSIISRAAIDAARAKEGQP